MFPSPCPALEADAFFDVPPDFELPDLDPFVALAFDPFVDFELALADEVLLVFEPADFVSAIM